MLLRRIINTSNCILFILEKIPVKKYTDTMIFLTHGHSQCDLG